MGQTENKTLQEGDNAELYCNMSGFPDPTVMWTKVQDGDYNAEEGKLLNITNITRAQAGKYKCNANNTCGEESAVAYIDVQCKNVMFQECNKTQSLRLMQVREVVCGN